MNLQPVENFLCESKSYEMKWSWGVRCCLPCIHLTGPFIVILSTTGHFGWYLAVLDPSSFSQDGNNGEDEKSNSVGPDGESLSVFFCSLKYNLSPVVKIGVRSEQKFGWGGGILRLLSGRG